jgi:hypothetical protein
LTFWVHPKIIKILDANNPQGTGQLAMDILGAMENGSQEQVPPKQNHHLMVYL